MKIHKTLPEENIQWKADSPSVRGMRLILPIAALLSAVSLAGGIAAFLEIELSSTLGILAVILFAVGAWYFDSLAVSSGQSVVRDFILGKGEQIEMGTLFWINVAFAAIISLAMVYGSFQMSRNGIAYLVLEVRSARAIATQTDTVLTESVTGAAAQNDAILQAKQKAYDARVAAVQATYAGRIEALEAEIDRRRRQRNQENRYHIDNQVQKLKKQIGEVKAEQGAELAKLATAFAAEQDRLLAGNEDLQEVAVEDAKAASMRQKEQQAVKDRMDRSLSTLVSSIFSWSVVLMLIIGLRLTMLETRNGILPNPILTNADVSGQAMLFRFLLAVPHFIFSCLAWLSEWLYRKAPKHRTPVVDNDLVDFKSAQAKVVAIRKESKAKPKKAAAALTEIGFKRSGELAAQGPEVGSGKVGSGMVEQEKLGSAKVGSSAAEPEKVGSKKPGSDPKKLANKGSRFFSGTKTPKSETGTPAKVGSETNLSEAEKELIRQIRYSKKELTKYKKRVASSYQKIKADERAGKTPKTQTLNAYENRKSKVDELTAEIEQLEAKLKSMS
ncbi:hypothetical protein [Flavilitoribacter nigricans]|uniref:DUF4407 domain-containing protein n=1 Tax=Flavilitoribacter nigricans (strain ATCC 23147 / DSM 23189 / NBRC 102662 / NCIMB 1420 / SS-2) TaxID=1122177 RepID=A0A2D0NCM2_FLAN2|nr:hypothetical protein [Flavilitoribacter nigricans]PHN06148.1 hypothetical protein CRP01_11225 [Flavilitoribacter nigricans DSM 23189 = NBRC 102662]